MRHYRGIVHLYISFHIPLGFVSWRLSDLSLNVIVADMILDLSHSLVTTMVLINSGALRNLPRFQRPVSNRFHLCDAFLALPDNLNLKPAITPILCRAEILGNLW